MDLEEFVSDTLVQIANGVADANEKLKENGARVIPASGIMERSIAATKPIPKPSPDIHNIAFDVAVTVTDESADGAGINVAFFSAKADIQKSVSDSRISRVKFSLPIRFPSSGDPAPKREERSLSEMKKAAD